MGGEAKADITLTEPEALKVFADPLVYPNGKNISCFECYNGSIDLQVSKGTPPYSYVWQDAAITTQDRSGLGAKSYEVMVTDANGCVEKAAIALEQPESNDWKMGGNAGTNPTHSFAILPVLQRDEPLSFDTLIDSSIASPGQSPEAIARITSPPPENMRCLRKLRKLPAA